MPVSTRWSALMNTGWFSRKIHFILTLAHYVNRKLDVQKMNEAANLMLGYTDFECFSKANTDVNTYLCELKKAQWEEVEDRLVFTISADRFLRNMVRGNSRNALGSWTRKMEH